jgi:hypothetical protein
MAHYFALCLSVSHPRLNNADVYLFDAAPHRTVMVIACAAGVPPSVPEASHPAALYEFRFATTSSGHDDTECPLRLTEPAARDERGPRQDFTVNHVTGVGMVDGFAGPVGDMRAGDRFGVWACWTRSTSTCAWMEPRTRIGVRSLSAVTRWRRDDQLSRLSTAAHRVVKATYGLRVP